METIKKEIEYKYQTDDLIVMVVEFLHDVNNEIKEKQYTLSDESKQSLKLMMKIKSILNKGVDWKKYMNRLSKNGRKKINKHIRNYEHKKSLRSMNKVFNYLYSRVLSDRNDYGYTSFISPDWISKVRINPSQKHLDNQKKRKEWLKLRHEAEIALKAYKDEKGDFYK